MTNTKYLLLVLLKLILMTPLLTMVMMNIIEGRSFSILQMLVPVALFLLAVIYKKW